MGKSRPPDRRRRVATRSLAALAIAALVIVVLATTALAAASATTGGVTMITPTSVTLTGTVNTTHDGAHWFFEYGTSTAYGKTTAEGQVSSGSTPVSAPITGLMPATTYHYVLVVNDGTYSENASGADRTFTTPATPGTIATTGQATSITATSAELNGVADPSQPDATWLFQYGTTIAYGHATNTSSTGSGLAVVSAKVTGLAPGTRYHFRLVVKQPGPALATSTGRDSSFTTARAFGRAHLRRHHLLVRHGRAAIPFKCAGIRGSLCRGKVSLSARSGGGKHAGTISCGTAQLATTAAHKRTVHVKLRGRCSALIAKARHHVLQARLRVVFSGHQRALDTGVELRGS